MPTNLEDWAQPAPDSQSLEDKLKSAISPQQAEPQNQVMQKMYSYIGTKIVCAEPMDENSFLSSYKRQELVDRETQPGYLVVYEDGYKSWSPKEVFERAYRRITQEEKRLI